MPIMNAGNGKVVLKTPVFHEIHDAGYQAVDMHVHSRHSDAAHSARAILAHARKLGIGVAFTDHNEIGAVAEASSVSSDLMVIPGIELSAAEGPHLLLYFYTVPDLVDFYTRHISPCLGRSRFMALTLPLEKILEKTEEFNCVRVAAHPFGYFGINRGILKCIDNMLLPAGIMHHIDAIEAVCGGMGRDLNNRAAVYADLHQFPIIGGSDAHMIRSVGSVVTCVHAGSVEEFLKGILRREAMVIGSAAGPLHKGMTGAIITWRFLPYAFSSLQVHYEQNMPGIVQFVKRLRR